MEDGKPQSASWIWENLVVSESTVLRTRSTGRGGPSIRAGEDALPTPRQAERGETQVLGGWVRPTRVGESDPLYSAQSHQETSS